MGLTPPGQNGRHFADNIFRCIFLNEKICILIEISLKFVLEGSIENKENLDNGLAPNRRQAIIWTNADSINWRIYVALGGDELRLADHSYKAQTACIFLGVYFELIVA